MKMKFHKPPDSFASGHQITDITNKINAIKNSESISEVLNISRKCPEVFFSSRSFKAGIIKLIPTRNQLDHGGRRICSTNECIRVLLGLILGG
jgi:hypothetical protein